MSPGNTHSLRKWVGVGRCGFVWVCVSVCVCVCGGKKCHPCNWYAEAEGNNSLLPFHLPHVPKGQGKIWPIISF